MREVFGFQMVKADREGELLSLSMHPEDGVRALPSGL